jgi:glutaredoxin
VHVTLFSRRGCHLCDVAREVILSERARSGFTFQEIDIETSDELIKEYGVRIPVVALDGEERFEIAVDPEELASLVRGRG